MISSFASFCFLFFLLVLFSCLPFIVCSDFHSYLLSFDASLTPSSLLIHADLFYSFPLSAPRIPYKIPSPSSLFSATLSPLAPMASFSLNDQQDLLLFFALSNAAPPSGGMQQSLYSISITDGKSSIRPLVNLPLPPSSYSFLSPLLLDSDILLTIDSVSHSFVFFDGNSMEYEGTALKGGVKPIGGSGGGALIMNDANNNDNVKIVFVAHLYPTVNDTDSIVFVSLSDLRYSITNTSFTPRVTPLVTNIGNIVSLSLDSGGDHKTLYWAESFVTNENQLIHGGSTGSSTEGGGAVYGPGLHSISLDTLDPSKPVSSISYPHSSIMDYYSVPAAPYSGPSLQSVTASSSEFIYFIQSDYRSIHRLKKGNGVASTSPIPSDSNPILAEELALTHQRPIQINQLKNGRIFLLLMGTSDPIQRCNATLNTPPSSSSSSPPAFCSSYLADWGSSSSPPLPPSDPNNVFAERLSSFYEAALHSDSVSDTCLALAAPLACFQYFSNYQQTLQQNRCNGFIRSRVCSSVCRSRCAAEVCNGLPGVAADGEGSMNCVTINLSPASGPGDSRIFGVLLSIIILLIFISVSSYSYLYWKRKHAANPLAHRRLMEEYQDADPEGDEKQIELKSQRQQS